MGRAVPLVVLTGASGSGKTTLARAVEARRGGQVPP
jgi:predicted ATPase